MGSVWYVVPSKRPAEQCEPVFQAWRDMGYHVLIQRDESEKAGGLLDGHWEQAEFSAQVWYRPYSGYAEAVNFLVREAIGDPNCEWIVTGGDDILPDPNKSAEDIAEECSRHFARRNERKYDFNPCTFGVMQPTGDDWGESEAWARQRYPEGRRRYIERVLGSPWMGREWCRRMYGGRGPLCEEYFHMFEDEEHQCVAERMGLLWQRRDLTHMHQHYSRMGQPLPAFLARATSGEHWKQAQTIFERRRAAGFPGHEPIA